MVEFAVSVVCSNCHGKNCTRFQWVDNPEFEYWICWDCDYIFTIDIVILEMMGFRTPEWAN